MNEPIGQHAAAQNAMKEYSLRMSRMVADMQKWGRDKIDDSCPLKGQRDE